MAENNGINNKKAEAKWNAIKQATDIPFSKMLDGTASKADISEAAALIAKYNELAHSIFKEGIESAEKTADTIIDNLNQDRVASGKKPLTAKAVERLHARTLRDVLQEAASDIIGMVHDAINEQEPTLSTKSETEPAFDSQLSRLFSDFVNKTTPADAGEQPFEYKPAYTIADVIASIKSQKGEDSDTEDTNSRPTVQLNPTTENALLDNANSQLDLEKKVDDELKKKKKKKKKDDDEEEEKKATAWYRKFGSFFSKTKKKIGGTAGWIKALLGGLGLLLLAPGLVTTISKHVRSFFNLEKISSFLESSWNDVKSAGSEMIDRVLKMTGLREKTKEEKRQEAASQLPKLEANITNLETRINQAQQRVDEAKAKGERANPADLKVLYYGKGTLATMKQVRDEDTAMLKKAALEESKTQVVSKEDSKPAPGSAQSVVSLVGNVTKAESPTYDKPPASSAPGTMPSPITNVGDTSTTSTINVNPRSINSTVVNPVQSVGPVEPIIMEKPKPIVKEQSQKREMMSSGSAAIGLGSFGMSPTSDNQLLILNAATLY